MLADGLIILYSISFNAELNTSEISHKSSTDAYGILITIKHPAVRVCLWMMVKWDYCVKLFSGNKIKGKQLYIKRYQRMNFLW